MADAKPSGSGKTRAKKSSVETYMNPAGFIEQHFIGVQSPESLSSAVKELVKRAKKLKSNNKAALILIDATEVPKIDVSGRMVRARKEAVKAMISAEYDRIAIYAGLPVQIMANTLVLIARKRDKVRVFSDRTDAIKWLKSTK